MYSRAHSELKYRVKVGKLWPVGRIQPATMLHLAHEYLQELGMKKDSTYWKRLSIYCPVAMSTVTMRPTKESNCPPLCEEERRKKIVANQEQVEPQRVADASVT